jgi:hypothetical protein
VRLKRHRAGRSARETWRANRRRAIKRAWRLNLLSAALLAGCVVGIMFSEGFAELVWAGVIGCVLTTHGFMWTLGGHVDQLRWMRGSWGEEATEDELERLGPAWHIEHDIPRTRGNWDHVAVSHAGVFALESKWTSAAAVVSGDELRLGRVPYSAGTFRGAAVDLRNTLAAANAQAPWVTAVVVIWGKFEQGVVEGDRVTFVAGARLAEWLREQPPRLSESRAESLAAAIREIARTPA